MADFIGIDVEGDRLTALRFEQFPQFAHDHLKSALQRIEERLEAAIRAAEPDRTGKLRSDTGGKIYETETRIAAVVGVRIDESMGKTARGSSAAGKAAALEYGSKEAFAVRAHGMALGHLFDRAWGPARVTVPEHMRQTGGIAPHGFLRGPIAAMREQALAEMRQALVEAEAQAAQ